MSDTAACTRSAPGGTVAFSSSDANASFSGSPCTLSSSGGGLAYVTNLQITNGTVTLSSGGSVPVGSAHTQLNTAKSVVLTATRTNPNQATFWSFDAVDQAGLPMHCA